MVGLADLLARNGQFEVVFLNSHDGGSLCILAPEGLPDSFVVRRSANSDKNEQPVELFRTMTLKIRKEGDNTVTYNEDTMGYLIKTLLERDKALDQVGQVKEDDFLEEKEEDSFQTSSGSPRINLVIDAAPAMESIDVHGFGERVGVGSPPIFTEALTTNSLITYASLSSPEPFIATTEVTYDQARLDIPALDIKELHPSMEMQFSKIPTDSTHNHVPSQDGTNLIIGNFSGSDANPPMNIPSYNRQGNKTTLGHAEFVIYSGNESELEPLSPLSLPLSKFAISAITVTTDDTLDQAKKAGLSSSKYAAAIDIEHTETSITGLPDNLQTPLSEPQSTPPVTESTSSTLCISISENGPSSTRMPTSSPLGSSACTPLPKPTKSCTSETDNTIPHTAMPGKTSPRESSASSEPPAVTKQIPETQSPELSSTRGSDAESKKAAANPAAATPNPIDQLRPPVGVKKWCSFFFQYGKCAYMQTGCRYSHEQPPAGIDIFSEYYGREHEMPKDYGIEHPRRSSLSRAGGGGLTAREARLALDAREQREALRKAAAAAAAAAKGLSSSRYYSSGTETTKGSAKSSKSSSSKKAGNREWPGKKLPPIVSKRIADDDGDDSEASAVFKEKKKRGRRGGKEKVTTEDEKKKKKNSSKSKLKIVSNNTNANVNTSSSNGVDNNNKEEAEELLVVLDEETPCELSKFESLLK